jgi:hypothetical protein
MPRVHSQKAAKDYPNIDVKKGETYYWWEFRYGGKHMSKTPPRPSQLTQSKMSGAYAASESAQDTIASADSIDDIAEALRDAANSIREVAEEYEEAANAEGANGNRIPQADEMEEKAQGLNDWADQLESDADDVEGLSADDYVDDTVEVDSLDDEHVETETVDGEEVKKRKDVSDFDDLTTDEQSAMLDAAREAATANLDCPL